MGKLVPEYPEWSGCQSQRRVPARVIICCRKGDPFQGQKVGFCLSLGNKLFEETCAENARDLIGKGYPGREQ